MTGWSKPNYEIRVAFHAPLKYVFEWCTDFSAADPALEGELYERRVVQRTSRRVVFEDLQATPSGWRWTREDVTLRPPNRWHMVSVGNYRDVVADYRLTTLKDGRTELVLSWRRRPTALGIRNPTRSEIVSGTAKSWKGFARALERDYKRT